MGVVVEHAGDDCKTSAVTISPGRLVVYWRAQAVCNNKLCVVRDFQKIVRQFAQCYPSHDFGLWEPNFAGPLSLGSC